MVLGGLLLISGGIVYKIDNTPSKIPMDTTIQMNHVIDLAIADGVLTKREEQKIIALAKESKLDASALIKEAKARIELSEDESETEIVNHIKKSGDDFEKYVVQKFSRKFFNVVEWAGDKYVDGIYADTTLHPDLLMELKVNGINEQFYVECKWRSRYNADEVVFAREYQLVRYKQFEKEKNIPVFIALGIGGKASNPDFMYTLPLRHISSNSITKKELKKYQKNINKDFYYDTKDNLLK